MDKKILIILFLISFSFLFEEKVAFASTSLGTISDNAFTSRFLKLPEIAKTSTSSQDVYWNTPAPYNVEISDYKLKGYLWGPLVGYISLSCENTSSCATSDFKVTNNNGELAGYAWGENTGWISFSCANQETNNCSLNNNARVTINSNGEFTGYAWSQNFGWISFDCSSSSSCVKTNWRKPSAQTLPSATLSSSGGSGIFVNKNDLQTYQRINEEKINDDPSYKEKKDETPTKKDIVKPSFQKEETKITAKEAGVTMTCSGATCSGTSPFMFPFTSIAPNASQFKRLQTGNTFINSSPELVISSSEKRNPDLISVIARPPTISGKIKLFFSSLFSKNKISIPDTKTSEASIKKETSQQINTVTGWFKNFFHTK